MIQSVLLFALALGGCMVQSTDLCPSDWPLGDARLDRACRVRFCREEAEKYAAECPWLNADGTVSKPDDAGSDSGESQGDGGVPDADVPQCTSNEGCGATAPVCADGVCVACNDSADCSGRSDAPVCDVVSGACVACSGSELGLCGVDEVCRESAHECVQCNVNSECSSNSAARCDGNSCVACVEDADCGHLDGKVCDAGLCVQCTPAKEATACFDTDPAPGDQSRACDPVAKTCTGKVRGSVSWCGGCASDSECIDGHRCLAMNFAGAPHGNYCVAIAPQGLCPPASRSKRSATSVLGEQAEYCFPAEPLTTCEAELEFGSACTADSECGADGLNDGLCVGPTGAKVCTYECTADRDCRGGGAGSCTGPASRQYCNPN